MIRRTTTLVETKLPQASPYGLLSPAVEVVRETSNDWLNGFVYETPDGRVDVVNQVINGGDVTSKSTVVDGNPQNPTLRAYYPFDIQASVRSSTFGVTIEDVQKAADNALEVVTQKAIETEFWTGAIAKTLTATDHENRYLSHADAFDVTPIANTPVKVGYGLALLEQAIGNATVGAQGTIHAPLLIASALPVSDNGGVLTTKLGSKVVAGSGYSNIGPNGVIAPVDTAWMYATGPVTVRIGKTPVVTPEMVSEAVKIDNNTVEFYVDRPAAVTWSTSFLYAVLVDLKLDYS